MRLTRAKSFHGLKILLCALLACPPGLPSPESAAGGARRPASSAPASSADRPGFCSHKPDRRPSHLATDWSVEADEPEGLADLDDARPDLLALPHRTLDHPSLVPAPLDSRPLGRAVAFARCPHNPPLRC